MRFFVDFVFTQGHTVSMQRTDTTHPLLLWLASQPRTAADFAREMKVSRAYMSLIVTGQRHPRQFLLKVSERTGISYDRLRTWKPAQQEAA